MYSRQSDSGLNEIYLKNIHSKRPRAATSL